jgi:hypothetical protein
MAELIILGEKLAAAGFPILLFIILVGSYYDIWVWGRNHRAICKEYDDRILKAEAETAKAEAKTEKWMEMTFAATGLSESLADLAKKGK